MQKYTQLTYEQRYHIYLLNKQGYNQTFIAKSIGICEFNGFIFLLMSFVSKPVGLLMAIASFASIAR
jgi:hypothetical protein